MNAGSGGLGAVSHGISELVVIGVLVVIVAFVCWKLVQFFVAAGK